MAGFIGVDAPLLGLSSAIQGATAGTMAGTTAGAAPEVTAILPPGGDAASAAAAAGLSARGAAAVAMLTELTGGHALFADTVGDERAQLHRPGRHQPGRGRRRAGPVEACGLADGGIWGLCC